MANKRRKHIKDSDMEWIIAAMFVLLICMYLYFKNVKGACICIV
jgi:hypothetical protein